MQENEEIVKKLEEAYTQIERHLEEGVTYYSMPKVTTFGTVGGRLFTLENDRRIYVDRKKQEDLDLFSLTKTFPAQSIVKYTFKKDVPVTVEVCSPEMLISEMKLGMKEEQQRRVEMLRVTEQPEEASLMNIEIQARFLKKGKMDILEKQTFADGSTSEEVDSCIQDELEAMYQALDGNISKIYVALIDGEITVQTTPAIPGLTSEVIVEKKDLTLDASSLKAIYGFMESHDEEKIARAVEVLQNNPDLLQKAEKRYLHLVRARLNDPAATLARFQEAALQRSEVSMLLGEHFAKDFISFSYFDDSETKLAVDFIGSMVQSSLDTEDYIAQAVRLSTEEELKAFYTEQAAKIKSEILAEAKVYPAGWYSKISTHLVKLRVKRLLFEKTKFDEANRSLALKAFVFFLNINSSSVYLDVFQSEVPELTGMFWLLKSVPESSWGDTELALPDSPLRFSRTARYRIGDEGAWKKIEKP